MIKIKLCAFSDEADASLEGQIAALRRNNVPYMEMRNVNGKNVTELTLDEAKDVRKQLDENGIKVWSIGSPIGKVDINTDFDEYLKLVKHTCELAVILGAKNIRMFSFFNAYNEREKVMKYLNIMAETALSYGVYLHHENEKDIYGDTAERVKDIMENTKGLKFIYDPANYLQCGEKADDTLDMFHAKTDYFHIKDVTASGAIVPAGCGDGKIEELVSRITDDKTLTLEPHLTVFEGYSHIDKTELKHEYTFKNATEAFDAAVSAMKKILVNAGYQEIGDEFVK
ncbi:MAG: sugar phosphate isomerase/epimerase [Clostridia bacterium]|nr:sugar phosphate isomerase/epimerase [Clostridia bacterium]